MRERTAEIQASSTINVNLGAAGTLPAEEWGKTLRQLRESIANEERPDCLFHIPGSPSFAIEEPQLVRSPDARSGSYDVTRYAIAGKGSQLDYDASFGMGETLVLPMVVPPLLGRWALGLLPNRIMRPRNHLVILRFLEHLPTGTIAKLPE